MKNINAMDILLAFQQIIVNKWRQLRHKNQYKKIVIATLLYLNVACFFICLLSILIIKVKSTIGFVESYLNLLCDDWRCKVHSLIRTSSKSYKFFNAWISSSFIPRIIYTKTISIQLTPFSGWCRPSFCLDELSSI